MRQPVVEKNQVFSVPMLPSGNVVGTIAQELGGSDAPPPPPPEPDPDAAYAAGEIPSVAIATTISALRVMRPPPFGRPLRT